MRTPAAGRGWFALLAVAGVLLALALPSRAVSDQHGIEITKEPDTQTVAEGDSASFTITVTNPSATETLTNVRIEDPLAPACAGTLRDLRPSESEIITCSSGPVAGEGFTNTATAKADLMGSAVEASDTAEVVVVRPQIEITKEPDTQQVVSGDTATFTITVYSPTCHPLSDVDISDPLAMDCERTDESIGCESSLTYDCTTDPLFADLTNVATVTALASNPQSEGSSVRVEDSDSAFVEVLGPGIAITKGPDTQQVVVGATATFDVAVRNSGDLPLTDIEITDPLTPDCDLSLAGPLAPGETIEYSCETDTLDDGFVNQIEVEATYDDEGTVKGSATAEVVVVEPSIEITKTPEDSQVFVGETVTFTIKITNLTPSVKAPIPPPSATLTMIDVSDPATPDCSRPLVPESGEESLGDLAPGEMHVYTCTTDPLGADLTNVITVTAKTDSKVPQEVGDEATAFVDVVSEVEVDKAPPEQAVPYGGKATFTITVTNPSDEITLDTVSVDDPLSPDCNRANLGPLAPGASSEPYECTSEPLFEDFVNVATATAGAELTGSDNAFVTVTLPSIEITKDPDGQSVIPGGQASYSITVTNPGPGDLTGVMVSDPLSPDCDSDIGDLAAGASVTYGCSSGALDADFTNTATVTATSDAGPVTAEAEAYINVLNPIDITKEPESQAVPFGGVATFVITITNNGTDELTDVTVVDDTTPDCSNAAIGRVGAGKPFVYSCEATGVTEAFTNTATAMGTAPSGPVQASDSAEVTIGPVEICAETETATGTGIAELCFTGGGPDCNFDSFFGVPISPIDPEPPAGLEFPHGLFDLAVVDCVPGSTLDFTLTLPGALSPETEYWKLGPTPTSPASAWYVLPSMIDGNVVSFSITDGGLGDRDGDPTNGRIEDPAGPATAAAVPSLPPAALAAMALALAFLGALALRWRRRAS